MAHDHLPAGFPGDPQQLLAFPDVWGDGLFQQNVIALPQGGNGLGDMLPVLGADENHVGQLRLSQKLLGGGEAVFGGNRKFTGHLCHLGRVTVRNGYNFCSVL